MRDCEAVIVGAGPNGLAAAIVLAAAGVKPLVLERAQQPGGGARTSELTLPGFFHDTCSTIHPLAFGSPLFRRLRLERYGLAAVHSPAALAHIVDTNTVVTLERSLGAMVGKLGGDGTAYHDVFAPIAEHFDALTDMALGPLRWPKKPLVLARFGLRALRPFEEFARSEFSGRGLQALLAGIAAHAMRPLDELATNSFALVLGGAAHAVGWPLTRGGSSSITSVLVELLRSLGGDVELGTEVRRFEDLPAARAYLFDVTPRQLLSIAGSRLPAGYRRRLERFRYGAGIFKVDWALSEPIPWRDPSCARAATVHLAGDLDAIAKGESLIHDGRVPEEPFIILVQPTLFDDTRAPVGKHIAWAYCHVPHRDLTDRTAAIELAIERFAPGFRDVVLARATRNSAELEAYDPNYVGGDINGGSAEWRQLFFRPVLSADPYATGAPDVFLCSSSTPPGGGVHGMCGYFAAKSALAHVFGRRPSDNLDFDRER
ncbi:MAG TPA: NAD(P)/FAD-dependent oxidoreductase [Polyangiaceae bacterium]|nr:NAD(P)/FAD-dependent oxidoreductase [Polyangiaceae bacterium]